MKCPNCNKEIPDTLIAKYLASKGGKKMISNLSQEELNKRTEKMREAKKNKKEIHDPVEWCDGNWRCSKCGDIVDIDNGKFGYCKK